MNKCSGGLRMPEDQKKPDELDVDLEKRATLRRMIASTAFVAPVVASFPISGLSIEKAAAATDPYYPFVDPFFRLFS